MKTLILIIALIFTSTNARAELSLTSFYLYPPVTTTSTAIVIQCPYYSYDYSAGAWRNSTTDLHLWTSHSSGEPQLMVTSNAGYSTTYYLTNTLPNFVTSIYVSKVDGVLRCSRDSSSSATHVYRREPAGRTCTPDTTKNQFTCTKNSSTSTQSSSVQ